MSAVHRLPDVCDRVEITAKQIAEKVRELGAEITGNHPDGDVRLVTVLRGGLFFLADLCREVEVARLTLDFMSVASFVPGQGASVRLIKDLDDDITGSNVVLVEDVVDTGLTVNYVYSLLKARSPASLELCTLLDKPARRIADVPITYCGFTLPDKFVVGYGLDLDGRYRTLPYIASLRDEVVLG
jgi:hypoxanthine phosphoribosyltransferase